MKRYRDEEREAPRPTVLGMVIIAYIHSMESSGGEEDSLESGDNRSFRIAVSCFFLSMGVCNQTRSTFNNFARFFAAYYYLKLEFKLIDSLRVNQIVPKIHSLRNECNRLQKYPSPFAATFLRSHFQKCIWWDHSKKLVKLYFSEVFFEEEGGVELEVSLGAGYDGSDHVEGSTVVLSPQFTVTSVSPEILPLRLVTSSNGERLEGAVSRVRFEGEGGTRPP